MSQLEKANAARDSRRVARTTSEEVIAIATTDTLEIPDIPISNDISEATKAFLLAE